VSFLAEVSYPRIDPILLEIGSLKVRWYGVTYIIAFIGAALILHHLAKRKRWPVAPEKVVDVLFWGILGVFIGGRVGYFFLYGLSLHYELSQLVEVWKGGMSFHGGLIGVIVAYSIYCYRTKTALGEMFDGLALALTPGLVAVRLGNFVNAELWGRLWDGPWAMRFPLYASFSKDGNDGIGAWEKAQASGVSHDQLWGPLRHPSQLYEMFGEGVVLFFFLRWLMLRRGVGGGRIAAAFLMAYGAIRFGLEFFRQPDPGIDFVFLNTFTRGQQLCFGMIVAGAIAWALCARKARRAAAAAREA